MSHNATHKPEPKLVSFICGGAAAISAEIATLPIDMAKVRLQLQANGPKLYKSMPDCIRQVAKTEGPKALYKGIVPAVLRQGSYSSLRMGIYEPIRDFISGGKAAKDITFLERTLAGGSAGAIGIAMANPTELMKVRMQMDRDGSRYPNGVIDAFIKTYKAEGIRGLWQGVIPNMQRAYIVNAAELAAYDQVKTTLVNTFGWDQDKTYTHLLSAMASGVFAALCSQPVDLVKNRLMNQKPDPQTGQLPYKGMIDCMVKTAKNEGIMSLYKGLSANMMRIGLWCVVMFTSFEQFRIAARRTYS